MKRTDFLDPNTIKDQSRDAILQIEEDIEALQLAYIAVNNFMHDTQIKSDAFDSLKKTFEQYRIIIGNMKKANECDKVDFKTLMNNVGSAVLDGGVIIPKKEAAWKSKISHEDKARANRDRAHNASNPLDAAYYYSMAAYYSTLATNDYITYCYWRGKEEEFDNIESLTSGLFKDSICFRELCLANTNDPNSVGLNPLTIVNNLADDVLKNKFKDRLDVTRKHREAYENACNKPLDFSSMTDDEKQIIIDYYEMTHPEDKKKMDKALKPFKDEGYDEHVTNIKVLTYTAADPYRELFIDHAKDVKVKNLHFKGTSHYSPNGYPFIDGIYLNVDGSDFDPTNASSYNVYFHEVSHGIDNRTGKGTAVTSTYRNSKGQSTNDVLQIDVTNNIANHAQNYFDSINLQEPDKSLYTYEVIDKIMNTIDASQDGMLSASDFSSKEAYDCYLEVTDSISNELSGRTSDVYGGFTGNTIYNRYLHYATTGKDENGNTYYRLYWVKGDIDEKGNRSIDYKDGNVQYTDHISSEFFAENMAANMTRETAEMNGYNYYSEDSREMFDELVNEMSGK